MKKLLLAATAVTALSAGNAQAVAVNGSFSGGFDIVTPGFLLAIGTTVNYAAVQSSTVSTAVGQFSPQAQGKAITTSNVSTTLSGVQAFAFSVATVGSWTGSLFNFLPSGNNNSQSVVINYQGLGTFTPTFGGFSPGLASITGSFTQDGGAGEAVSQSFTLSSPSRIEVPEPATLALLGAGLLGLGLARRRRG